MLNLKKAVLASIAAVSFMSAPAFAQDATMDMKFAGALEFSDQGTLFVGDNYNGAISVSYTHLTLPTIYSV